MIRGGQAAKNVAKRPDTEDSGKWKQAARDWGKAAAKSKAAEKKENMAKKIGKDGFDSNKRWGNSGIKGVGANSSAMMEARKKFEGNK